MASLSIGGVSLSPCWTTSSGKHTIFGVGSAAPPENAEDRRWAGHPRAVCRTPPRATTSASIADLLFAEVLRQCLPLPSSPWATDSFRRTTSLPLSRNQTGELTKHVAKLPRDDVLAVSETDLVEHLVSKYSINVPTLHREAMYVEEDDARFDISHQPGRDIVPGRSVFRPGTRVTVVVPFSGEKELLYFRPNQFGLNSPSADVQNDEIRLSYVVERVDADAIRSRYEAELESIDRHLGWIREDVDPFNQGLRNVAAAAVQMRRDRLLATDGALADLGLPIKRRAGVRSTYAIPDVKRKPRIVVPQPRSTEPFKQEPTLADTTYNEILKIVADMARVMEQSPHAFTELGEEDIRFHFLLPLNAQFEGNATGETFNYEGKTDILIRHDGRVVFVAECKIWSGPKALLGTIDQIRGYLSWRDTKAAILLFVRNRDFSKVLEKIPRAVEGHVGWKRTTDASGDPAFRFVFGNRDDPNREILLTVMPFAVPSPAADDDLAD